MSSQESAFSEVDGILCIEGKGTCFFVRRMILKTFPSEFNPNRCTNSHLLFFE